MPAISTLAAIGVIHLTQYCSQNRIRYFVIAIVVILQAAPVLRLHPYYMAYHFPLLPGNWISKNTTVGGGVGLDIAAAYLNAKPNAKNLRVRLGRFSTTLDKYFIGKTWKRQQTPAVRYKNLFDYDIEYVRARQIEGIPVDSPPAHTKPNVDFQPKNDLPRELEYVVQLNGVEYVWIYRVLPPFPILRTVPEALQ